MYRILVVDDEDIIVEGIAGLIEENFGENVEIFKEYSGKGALNVLNKIRIDILLTDICMPELSGDMLLEEVLDLWPKCKVIFLTGHSDFDYVYKAIKHNGVRYILKSESDAVILKNLHDAIAELNHDKLLNHILDKAQQQLDVALPVLKNNLMFDIVNGEPVEEEQLSEFFSTYEIDLSPKEPVALLMCRIESSEHLSAPSERLRLCYSLINTVQVQLGEVILAEYAIKRDARVVLCFFQPHKIQAADKAAEEVSWKRLFNFVRGNIDAIQSTCKEEFGASVSFALSSTAFAWNDLSSAYSSLRDLLNHGLGLGSNVILDGQKMFADGKPNMRTRIKEVEKLSYCLEAGKQEEFFEHYAAIAECLNSKTMAVQNIKEELYFSVALMLLSYINRWELEGNRKLDFNFDKLMHIEDHANWALASRYLMDIAQNLFNIRDVDREQSKFYITDTVKKYIEMNIGGDVSLVSLGELTGLNVSYLSRLFKQIEGVNITEYVNYVRIKKAKEHLSNRNLKIGEVAQVLGFRSISYFSFIFKKEVGLTPQEYRVKRMSSQD